MTMKSLTETERRERAAKAELSRSPKTEAEPQRLTRQQEQHAAMLRRLASKLQGLAPKHPNWCPLPMREKNRVSLGLTLEDVRDAFALYGVDTTTDELADLEHRAYTPLERDLWGSPVGALYLSFVRLIADGEAI